MMVGLCKPKKVKGYLLGITKKGRSSPAQKHDTQGYLGVRLGLLSGVVSQLSMQTGALSTMRRDVSLRWVPWEISAWAAWAQNTQIFGCLHLQITKAES